MRIFSIVSVLAVASLLSWFIISTEGSQSKFPVKLGLDLAGGTSLKEIELNELGEVAGKQLLHLQCHFGLDTLSLARLGAPEDIAAATAFLASEEASYITGTVVNVSGGLYM